MNKGRFVNKLFFAVAFVLIVVCALSVRPRASADRVAVLKTAGMTCGSCSARITQALQREPGVASVAVDLEGGRVTVAFDSHVIGAQALAACATRSGYASSVQQDLAVADYRRLTGVDPRQAYHGAGCRCSDKAGGGR